MTGICLPIDASSGSPSFPAKQHRDAQSAFMGPVSGRPLSSRSGLRLGADPAVTVTSTTYTVAPFSCIVDAATALDVGSYLCAFVANETGGINAAPGSGIRIDRLDVQVPDDPPSGARVCAVVYTAGVAGTGVPAAAPARSIPIGFITVPSSGAPSWAPARIYTTAAGAPIPVNSSAERAALPQVLGLSVLRLDARGRIEIYDGTAWNVVGEPAPTWAAITAFTTGASADATSPPEGRAWASGLCELRGEINAGSTFAPNGVQLATLPSGMAPAAVRRFPVVRNFVATNTGDLRGEVRSDGTLWLYTEGGETTWIDLGNARYWI